nr:unnamed protein product [Digitaria exilis]
MSDELIDGRKAGCSIDPAACGGVWWWLWECPVDSAMFLKAASGRVGSAAVWKGGLEREGTCGGGGGGMGGEVVGSRKVVDGHLSCPDGELNWDASIRPGPRRARRLVARAGSRLAALWPPPAVALQACSEPQAAHCRMEMGIRSHIPRVTAHQALDPPISSVEATHARFDRYLSIPIYLLTTTSSRATHAYVEAKPPRPADELSSDRRGRQPQLCYRHVVLPVAACLAPVTPAAAKASQTEHKPLEAPRASGGRAATWFAVGGSDRRELGAPVVAVGCQCWRSARSSLDHRPTCHVEGVRRRPCFDVRLRRGNITFTGDCWRKISPRAKKKNDHDVHVFRGAKKGPGKWGGASRASWQRGCDVARRPCTTTTYHVWDTVMEDEDTRVTNGTPARTETVAYLVRDRGSYPIHRTTTEIETNTWIQPSIGRKLMTTYTVPTTALGAASRLAPLVKFPRTAAFTHRTWMESWTELGREIRDARFRRYGDRFSGAPDLTWHLGNQCQQVDRATAAAEHRRRSRHGLVAPRAAGHVAEQRVRVATAGWLVVLVRSPSDTAPASWSTPSSTGHQNPLLDGDEDCRSPGEGNIRRRKSAWKICSRESEAWPDWYGNKSPSESCRYGLSSSDAMPIQISMPIHIVPFGTREESAEHVASADLPAPAGGVVSIQPQKQGPGEIAELTATRQASDTNASPTGGVDWLGFEVGGILLLRRYGAKLTHIHRRGRAAAQPAVVGRKVMGRSMDSFRLDLNRDCACAYSIHAASPPTGIIGIKNLQDSTTDLQDSRTHQLQAYESDSLPAGKDSCPHEDSLKSSLSRLRHENTRFA